MQWLIGLDDNLLQISYVEQKEKNCNRQIFFFFASRILSDNSCKEFIIRHLPVRLKACDVLLEV